MTCDSTYSDALLQRARNIRLVVFDVDGVLSDGRLYYDEQGREIKAFHARDGLGMNRLQHYGFELAVITGRDNPVVTHRMASLGIAHVYQGRHDKRIALEDLHHRLGLTMEQTCFVGDDLLDLPLLQRVGLAVVVADAHPWVVDQAHFITRNRGGRGAAREVCDLLLEAHGHRQAEMDFWSGA